MTIPTLFLVVDAIPLGLARAAWESDQMPEFCRPRPLISVFPSLTTVAVPALLSGAIDVRPPGYEIRYRHPSGELRGGWSEEPGLAPFRARPRGALGHIAVYALRRGLAWEQVRAIGWRFCRDGGPWLGYIAATDGVGHFGSRAALGGAFTDICTQVTAARDRFEREHGVRPRVVMCSDHGLEYGATDFLDSDELARLLKIAGVPGQLAPVGEVSAGAIWCPPQAAVAAARVAAEARGVEIAMARQGEGCVVFRVTHRGTEEARVDWCGSRYRYTPVHGDPLELGPVDDDDAAIFDRTWDHVFPDPLHRIRRGLTDLVDWPAPVLFSMDRGWTTGPALTRMAAEMMGGQTATHGALRRAQSQGFVAATSGDPEIAPGAVRAEQALAPFGDLVRLGRADR